MKINRILDYYYRSYSKAAQGKESARGTINAFKAAIGASQRPALYQRLKKIVARLAYGPVYWPNTFPWAVDEPTAGFLYSLVRLTQPEIAVEIGTARGNSAIAIAQGLEDNGRGKLYTIDLFEHELVKIAAKKSGLDHRIEHIIGHSRKVIPRLALQKCDFAFIDGDHAYESVSTDFRLVSDLVPPGGIIVIHDSLGHEGPKRVIEEIRATRNFEITTLPTLSGFVRNEYAVLSTDNRDTFMPAGVTVCRKAALANHLRLSSKGAQNSRGVLMGASPGVNRTKDY